MLSLRDWQLENRMRVKKLDLERGTFVHLLGPNGAGKSSLLEGLAGITHSEQGDIALMHRPLKEWTIAELTGLRCFLNQDNQCQFELSVSQVLGFFSEEQSIPKEIETGLEIADLLDSVINRLSSGQQQRVHIARVLMQVWSAIQKGNAIVLLDEPLRALDIVHQQSCLQLLNAISMRGNLVVISSHDINLSLQFASHIAFIKHGKLFKFGETRKVVNAESLKTVFNCDFHLVYSENAYDFFLPRVNS